jgi:hypothetical protein
MWGSIFGYLDPKNMFILTSVGKNKRGHIAYMALPVDVRSPTYHCNMRVSIAHLLGTWPWHQTRPISV